MKIAWKTLGRGVFACGIILIGGTACTSTGGGAQVVDVNEGITTTDQINTKDWLNAADKLSARIIASGELDKVPESKKPALIAFSLITNGTTEMIDMNWLTRRVSENLYNSGKSRSSTLIGIGGPQDPIASDARQLDTFENDGRPNNDQIPAFTLSGRILENRARDGNLREVTYVFTLKLTKLDGSGAAVWEGQEIIVKQSNKSTRGW